MSSLAVQIRQEKCTAVTKISRNSRLLFPANISLVKRLVESESERTPLWKLAFPRLGMVIRASR